VSRGSRYGDDGGDGGESDQGSSAFYLRAGDGGGELCGILGYEFGDGD